MTRADLEAAAAEKYPDVADREFVGDGSRARERAAYIQGRLDALPEVPDDAVIEAMAKGMYSEALPGRSWDRCPEDVKQHWRRYARAAYAAMRGAMQ